MPQNKTKRNAYPLDNENQLPGFPGYRTREGRSGLDPLDSNRESAFMEGTFYRRLFTLKLRTRNVFYLVLMFVFGVIPFALLILLISKTVLQGQPSDLVALIVPLIFTIITGVLTLNLLLSILEMVKIIPSSHRTHSKQGNPK